MTTHEHLTGAVLAGGRARRLAGANKTLLPIGPRGAETPLSRILDVFTPRFAETILVTHDAAPYRSLPVRVVADVIPGCGPLGGIHAALCASRTPYVFVCGGDMPSLSGPLIDLMTRRTREGRLLVPVWRGRPEPLHAIYPVSRRDDAREALEGGVRMMLDFFERVPVDYLSQEEYTAIEGAERSFVNINTPEDLASLDP